MSKYGKGDTAQQHLANQREYVKQRHLEDQRQSAKSSGASGLVDEAMLAQTMRSVRYADEAHAAGDIIDNAIESGATQVHVVYRTEGQAIKEIAFIDDGSGIDPSFLPHATKWGGSSNFGKRNVFGRYGFGLPSASVNRGTRFSVHSRLDGSTDYSSVTVDLNRLTVKGTVVQLPTVTLGGLPAWVEQYVEAASDAKTLRGGAEAIRTVVVWSELDRLTWKNRQQAAARFAEHLGITYASWLDVCSLFVDGRRVEPVDVLFTTPGYRWYEVPGYPKAESHPPIVFEAEDSNGVKHEVTVRFSLLGVDAHDAKASSGGRGAAPKVRQNVRKQYNGFFVTRNGRFIELARPSIITWDVYARQVGVALDFPPELDELFGVTPDKQTIHFSSALENMLVAHGVERAFSSLYKAVRNERRHRKVERDRLREEENAKRASEEAIEKTLARNFRRTRKTGEETQREADENFKNRVKELSNISGVDENTVAEAQHKEAAKRPYRVEFIDGTADDPFYVPRMDGTQTVLRINTEHPWYTEVYLRLGDSAEMRAALELTLFVLGTCELDAIDDSRVFYRAERMEWSRRLADAFDMFPLVFSGAASKQDLEAEHGDGWAEDDEGLGEAEQEAV